MTNEPLQLPYKYSGTALVSRDMIAASRHDILKTRREQLREQMALELFSKLIGAGPVVVNLTETMEPDLETRSVRVDVRANLSRPDSDQATITTLRERLAAAETLLETVPLSRTFHIGNGIAVIHSDGPAVGWYAYQETPGRVTCVMPSPIDALAAAMKCWLKPQPQAETAEER